MFWNYRAVRQEDGSIGLYEVYYDRAGEPQARTKDPVGFIVDPEEGLDELIKNVRWALEDIMARPLLDDAEIKGGFSWDDDDDGDDDDEVDA